MPLALNKNLFPTSCLVSLLPSTRTLGVAHVQSPTSPPTLSAPIGPPSCPHSSPESGVTTVTRYRPTPEPGAKLVPHARGFYQASACYSRRLTSLTEVSWGNASPGFGGLACLGCVGQCSGLQHPPSGGPVGRSPAVHLEAAQKDPGRARSSLLRTAGGPGRRVFQVHAGSPVPKGRCAL